MADAENGTDELPLKEDCNANAMGTGGTGPPPVTIDASTPLPTTPLSVPVRDRRELVQYDDVELISSDLDEFIEELASREHSSTSSSSSTDTERLLKEALVLFEDEVKGYDWKSPPQNGSQYLLYVKKQRKLMPKVVIAKPLLMDDQDDSKLIQLPMPKNILTPSALLEFTPTEGWTSIIVHQFSNLYLKVAYWREAMANYDFEIPLPEGLTFPPPFDRKSWFTFCFGSKLAQQVKACAPFQRKGVRTANSKSISSFFSEDFGLEEVPHGLTAAVEVGIANLIIEDQITNNSMAENEVESQKPDVVIGKTGNNDDCESESSSSSTPEQEILCYEKHSPLLSILLNMPDTMLEDVLKMHVAWVKHYGWFHEWQGKWIYALLACVEKPLSSDVIFDIRDLVRLCTKVRNSVCESKITASASQSYVVENGSGDTGAHERNKGVELPKGNETTEEKNDTELIQFKEFINTLNLFICLGGNYFQQYDLADTPQVQ